jgi:hypothetical protein
MSYIIYVTVPCVMTNRCRTITIVRVSMASVVEEYLTMKLISERYTEPQVAEPCVNKFSYELFHIYFALVSK